MTDIIKLASFTDLNSGEPVHVRSDRLIGFMNWHRSNAKPEDKPIGVLLIVDGVKEGILVSDTYGRVLNAFRHAGMEV